MTRKRTAAVAGGLIGLTLALSACTGGTAETDTSTDTDDTSVVAMSPVQSEDDVTYDAQSEEQSGDVEVVTGGISPEDAAGLALERVPGEVVGIEADRHRTTQIWEVVVRDESGSGTELYIDRQTGEILQESATRLSSAQQQSPTISVTEALAIIFEAVPGTLVEIDLDTERSVLQWEAEVSADRGGRYEVYVDATTGEIRKLERD